MVFFRFSMLSWRTVKGRKEDLPADLFPKSILESTPISSSSSSSSFSFASSLILSSLCLYLSFSFPPSSSQFCFSSPGVTEEVCVECLSACGVVCVWVCVCVRTGERATLLCCRPRWACCCDWLRDSVREGMSVYVCVCMCVCVCVREREREKEISSRTNTSSPQGNTPLPLLLPPFFFLPVFLSHQVFLFIHLITLKDSGVELFHLLFFSAILLEQILLLDSQF